jgi:serine phosphatase RsbU (regulator of sigma subunit)
LKRYLLIIVFFVFSGYVISQKYYTNPRYKKKDVDRVDSLSDALKAGDSVLFFKMHDRYLAEAKRDTIYYLWVYCYDKLAIYNYFKQDLDLSLLYYDTAVSVAKKYHLSDALSGLYMNKGAILYAQGKFTASLTNYKIAEELMIKNKMPKLGGLLGNISLLYQEIGDLENAKRYVYRSIPFVKLDKEPDTYAKLLNNLGLIFKKERNLKSADSIFHLGYEHTKLHHLDNDFADVTYNLAEVLYLQKKLKEARAIDEELLPVVTKLKGLSWQKLVLLDLAKVNFELKDLTASKKYLATAEAIKLDSDVSSREKQDHLALLGQMYMNLGQFEKSTRAFSEFIKLEQQYKGQNRDDVIGLQQLSYKLEKQQDSLNNAKEKEILALENQHEQEKAESKLKQQRIIIIISLIGFLAIIGFSISLIRANRSKEKANKEISYQKALLDEKNKEVTDSIRYAQRIQQSLLPPQDLLDILLPDHFLIYMPKDIVSGDFFWAKKINANEIFLAVADCTGHGVPGAMMSALSIQNLNELSSQTRSPGELLSLLNTNLKNTLNQDQVGFSKDGLDICLCKINVKERKITYSGANRNLNVFDRTGLKAELKATKAGIGGHTDVKQVYSELEVSVEENDMIVMSTDGFADQFGGTEGKKITTKRFKQWLTEIIFLDNKKGELLKRFSVWRGSTDQIDDVCVLGFRI